MLVGARMAYPAITVGIKTEVTEAEKILAEEDIRTMPVTDRQGRLMGMISRVGINDEKLSGRDLKGVLVEEIMQRRVLSVTENTPIEEAARMINDYRLSSLPVVQDGYVVGIITLANLMNALLEITGARLSGVRLTVQLVDGNASLVRLLEGIAELGANVCSVTSYSGEDISHKIVTLKVDHADKYSLKQVVLPLVDKLIDIR